MCGANGSTYGVAAWRMRCLTGRDLSDYHYISVEREGFVPIRVKSADIARLNDLTM